MFPRRQDVVDTISQIGKFAAKVSGMDKRRFGGKLADSRQNFSVYRRALGEADSVREICGDRVKPTADMARIAQLDIGVQPVMLQVFSRRAHHSGVDVVADGVQPHLCGFKYDRTRPATRIKEAVARHGD